MDKIKNQEIGRDLFIKILTGNKFVYTSPDQPLPLPPREHLLYVNITGGKLLIPNTTEYK
jgi:hypothetical protein